MKPEQEIHLMYHSFMSVPDRYHLTHQTFKSHVEHISQNPDIIVTIDDGAPSVHEVAFPILNEFNVSAIIFIDTAGIGNTRMGKEQIREMSAAGFDIQSHSHNHQNHYHLTDEEIIEEGHISKDILEEITGKPVNKYAFPGGAYDLRCCDILKSLGYNEFYTSNHGTNKKKIGEYTIFNRIEIFCERELNYFIRKDVIMRRRLRIELSKLKMWFTI